MERYRSIGADVAPHGSRPLHADLDLLRSDVDRLRDGRSSAGRCARRSYLYDPPPVSARRVRRQTGIAMAVIAVLLATMAAWGLIQIVHWLAAGIGSGLAPRVGLGTIRSVMMTLPIA